MDGGTVRITTSVRFTGVLNAQGVASSGLQAAKKAQTKTFDKTLQYGTGSGQVDTIICQVRELAAGASETLNLFDGSLLDIFGAAGGLQAVKEVLIWQVPNVDGSTPGTGLTVGAAAANATQLWFGDDADTCAINGLSGAPFHQGDDAGKAIDNSNKNLKVANNDGTNKASYFLLVTGRHV